MTEKKNEIQAWYNDGRMIITPEGELYRIKQEQEARLGQALWMLREAVDPEIRVEAERKHPCAATVNISGSNILIRQPDKFSEAMQLGFKLDTFNKTAGFMELIFTFEDLAERVYTVGEDPEAEKAELSEAADRLLQVLSEEGEFDWVKDVSQAPEEIDHRTLDSGRESVLVWLDSVNEFRPDDPIWQSVKEAESLSFVWVNEDESLLSVLFKPDPETEA